MKNTGRVLEMLRKQGAVRVRFKDGEIEEVEFPPPLDTVAAAAPVKIEHEPLPPEPKRSDLDALDDLPEYSS